MSGNHGLKNQLKFIWSSKKPLAKLLTEKLPNKLSNVMYYGKLEIHQKTVKQRLERN